MIRPRNRQIMLQYRCLVGPTLVWYRSRPKRSAALNFNRRWDESCHSAERELTAPGNDMGLEQTAVLSQRRGSESLLRYGEEGRDGLNQRSRFYRDLMCFGPGGNLHPDLLKNFFAGLRVKGSSSEGRWGFPLPPTVRAQPDSAKSVVRARHPKYGVTTVVGCQLSPMEPIGIEPTTS